MTKNNVLICFFGNVLRVWSALLSLLLSRPAEFYRRFLAGRSLHISYASLPYTQNINIREHFLVKPLSGCEFQLIPLFFRLLERICRLSSFPLFRYNISITLHKETGQRMKRRMLFIGIIAVLFAFALAACGDNDSNENAAVEDENGNDIELGDTDITLGTDDYVSNTSNTYVAKLLLEE